MKTLIINKQELAIIILWEHTCEYDEQQTHSGARTDSSN